MLSVCLLAGWKLVRVEAGIILVGIRIQILWIYVDLVLEDTVKLSVLIQTFLQGLYVLILIVVLVVATLQLFAQLEVFQGLLKLVFLVCGLQKAIVYLEFIVLAVWVL